MPRSRHAWILALALAGSGFSCAAVEEAASRARPKVVFHGEKVDEIDFDDVEVRLLFELDDPPGVDYDLRSASYALSMDGVELMRRDRVPAHELPEVAEGRILLPVRLAYEDIFDKVGPMKGQDAAPYVVSGTFDFDGPDGPVAVPYRDGGTFPIVRAPTFALAGVRVRDLDIAAGTVVVAVELAVTYDGAETVTLRRFDYEITMADRVVAAGRANELRAPGEAGATLSVPLTLRLVDIGAAVYDVLRDKASLSVGVSGTLIVDTPFGAIEMSVDKAGELTVR